MTLPNKLTLVRCVLTFVFLAVLLMDFPFHYGAALLIFIVASLTDMLDGKIARNRHLVTNLGKFLDPLADKALTTAAFLGIMSRLVTSVRLLAAKDGVVIAASKAGKLKTVMQMVAVIYMLAAMQVCTWRVFDNTINTVLLLIGVVLIWVSVVFTVISGVQYVWNCRHYFQENA